MLLSTNNTFLSTFLFLAISAVLCTQSARAQTPPAQNPPAPAPAPQNLPKLSLQEAEAMAIQNHPQIQAAQNQVNYSNQQIVESRSAYYPTVTGDITGSQGNNLARIGAGDLAASRLFDRFGQGLVLNQLITDSGRTLKAAPGVARLLGGAGERGHGSVRTRCVCAAARQAGRAARGVSGRRTDTGSARARRPQAGA